MHLLTALRTYLVDQGVGRHPRTAGPLPPVWVHPVNGTPAPGETPGAPVEAGEQVIGLYRAGGIRSGPFEAWLQRALVDVHIRTRTVPAAVDLGRQLRVAVIGVTPAPKTAWLMGGLQVIAAQEWRPLQPLPAEQGVLFTTAFLLSTYA